MSYFDPNRYGPPTAASDIAGAWGAAFAQAKKDRQDRAINEQIAAGNYVGAQQEAIKANRYDHVEHIQGFQDSERKRAAGQAQAIGQVAYTLRQQPPEERWKTLAALAPQLRQMGVTEEQFASIDVSDQELDGYIGLSLSLKEQMERDDKIADRTKPVTVGMEQRLAVPTLDANGRVTGATVAVDGQPKLESVTVTNADGSSSATTFNPYSGTYGSAAAGQQPGPQGDPAPAAVQPQPGSMAAPQAAVATVLATKLPAPVVAGMLGNFEVEGGYGGAQGDNGSASGIAQWRKERRDNFRARYGKEPHQASHEEQAQFVLWEMENPRAAGMTVEQRNAILAARTPEEAADLIDRYYERSTGAHRRRRIAHANRYGSALGGAPAEAPAQGSAPVAGSDAYSFSGQRGNGRSNRAATTAEVAELGLTPGTAVWFDAKGQPRVQERPAKPAAQKLLKAWPQGAVEAYTSTNDALSYVNRALALLDPKNNSQEAQDARQAFGVKNFAGRIPGGSMALSYLDADGNVIRTTVGKVGSAVIKDMSGAAVSIHEDARLSQWVPNFETDTPERAREKLMQMRGSLVQRQQAIEGNYNPDSGYRSIRPPRSGGGNSGGVRRVQSIEEARQLPKGTRFIDPNGVERIR